MNEIFKIYNLILTLNISEEKILKKLYGYLSGESQDNNEYLFKLLSKNNHTDPLKIFQLIGLIHQKKKESEKIVNTNNRKHFGIYYTDYEIARTLARDNLKKVKKEDVVNLKFYEPCAGGGIFIIAYIDEVISKINNDTSKINKLFKNIYFSDIDKEAVHNILKIVPLYIKFKYKILVKFSKQNYFTGDALFKIKKSVITKNNPLETFNIKNGFDVILTNPPYKLLKANSNEYSDSINKNIHAVNTKELIQFIKKNKIYNYNQGTLNFYKIFLEEILENYSHKKSRIGVLIPSTILGDYQSSLLRKRIIDKYIIPSLYIIPEKNNFFPDITQSFCFFTVDKGGVGNVIKVNLEFTGSENFNAKNIITIRSEDVRSTGAHYPIVIESEVGIRILKKLNKFPKLGSFTSIYNGRGELDLTLNKKYITKDKTNLRLLKGVNIKEFSHSKNEYYIDEDFMDTVGQKQKFILEERIACQQISNINTEKRLNFTRVKSGYVLGNSCNFLGCENESLFKEKEIVDLGFLLGVLNSFLLNWRFNITNSNNHISNYELSDLPIAVPSVKEFAKIKEIVKRLEERKDMEDIIELNNYIFDIYGLNKKEKEYIMNKHKKFMNKYDLNKNNLFNYENI